MTSQSVEKEYRGMLDAYEKAGGDKNALKSKDTAKLVIHKNKVLGSDGVKGLKVETRETKTGVDVHLHSRGRSEDTPPRPPLLWRSAQRRTAGNYHEGDG